MPSVSGYVLELRDGDGREHRLTSLSTPTLFDAAGNPMLLRAELAEGSEVKVDVAENGRTMRAVQVIRHVVRNPFA